DDRGHELPVHVTFLASQRLDAGDAVLARLVGEHRPVDDVADRVDARHRGLEVRVDLDAAARRELDAGLVEPEAFNGGPPADADQHDVGFDGLDGTPFRRLYRERDAGIRRLRLGHLRAEPELHALPGKRALELPGDLVVDARRDAVE